MRISWLKAIHVEGILLIEVLMREAGMSRSRAAEVNIYVIFEILYGSN